MSAAPRVAPAEPPYPAEIQARFDALMPPGVAPLVLFRALARDGRAAKAQHGHIHVCSAESTFLHQSTLDTT